MHRTHPRFWRCYENLPKPIRELASRNFDLLKRDPRHPSLHFKRVGEFWSVRVGLSHRALATEDGEDYVWIWIGAHDDYAKLIRRGS